MLASCLCTIEVCQNIFVPGQKLTSSRDFCSDLRTSFFTPFSRAKHLTFFTKSASEGRLAFRSSSNCNKNMVARSHSKSHKCTILCTVYYACYSLFTWASAVLLRCNKYGTSSSGSSCISIKHICLFHRIVAKYSVLGSYQQFAVLFAYH